MAGFPSAVSIPPLFGLLSLLGAGCSFDSSGLAPSSPPAGEDAAAELGSLDQGKITKKDGPPAKLDTKPKPPPDSTPKGCPTGKIRCAEFCVNPSVDDANCGGCGAKCKASEKCTSGLCCTKGWANCDHQCANLKEDINNCGKCGQKCKSSFACLGGKCCPSGWSKCWHVCANLATDNSHCGKCGVNCKASEACSSGKCCLKGWSKCGSKCANLATDNSNCGKCGQLCKAGEVCAGGKCGTTAGCVDGTVEQDFGGGMIGCAGKVTFPKRVSLCNPQKYKTCTAVQWVTGHGAKAPKYNYWTDNVLHYLGPKSYCYVSPSYGNKCWPAMPMRVCAGDPDPLGNKCNWMGCGYNTPTPKHFFGGCNDNPTAGTLCCPK